MKNIFWCLCSLLFFVLFLPAQAPETKEIPQIEKVEVDIWSLRLGMGGRLFHNDVVKISNSLFPLSSIQQSVEDTGWGVVELGIQWGLDRYLIPGIGVGLKLDYSYVNIENLELRAIQGGNQAFVHDGKFLLADCVGVVPYVEFRIFTMLEYFLRKDFSPAWEISLYAGPRFNIHLYSDKGLDIKDLQTFSVSYEAGLAIDIFFARSWTLRMEYGYSGDSSDFSIAQDNVKVFSGKLNLDHSKFLLGLQYYF